MSEKTSTPMPEIKKGDSWELFRIADAGQKADLPRSLNTLEGIGDRLRSAAFAEIQARDAFRWAATYYPDAPASLRTAWLGLAHAEQRHLDWLLKRSDELKIELQERRVSNQLWTSLLSCQTAREFALYMASAEERGRKAGVRFHEALLTSDPITAEIFRKIAEEEVAHIDLAYEYFPGPRFA